MTPMDLFVWGLWSGAIWLVVFISIVLMSAWGDAWDKIDGAIEGVFPGLIISLGGFSITAGICWIAAVVLWIITL